MRERTADTWLGVAGLVAVVMIAFAFGAHFGGSLEREASQRQDAQEEHQEALQQAQEQKDENEAPLPYGDDAIGGIALTIDWAVSDKAEPADPKFLAALKDRAFVGGEAKGSVMYKLGTVTGDLYAGDALYMVVLEMNGLGPQYEYYYLLTDYGSSSQVTLINSSAGPASLYAQQYTAEELMGDSFAAAGFIDVKDATPVQLGMVVTVDRDVYIPELQEEKVGDLASVSDMIESVHGTGTHDLVVLGVGKRLEAYPEDADIVSKMQDDGFLYEPTEGSGKNLFYSIRNDYRTVWYDVVIPFWGPTAETTAVPTITWSDGAKNGETYMKGEVGGCGFSTMTKVIDVAELGSLVQSGTASTGEAVYGQKDTNSDRLKTAFSTWAIQHQDKTYADFLAQRPFFYYEDSFGRWIEFTNTQVMPPGECGKPVIYLYPTTTQDLTVQLAPQGGFTKSEPAYGNGWHVKATPAGILTNAADGKSYPYLFWEGRGGLYQEPTGYWVVAKKDVHGFLSSTLTKLGLNAKEIADFEEFWEPRMTSASYYKIGFHGTETMNQIAPMTLSQKPDTLIRVLMDYAPLSAPIAQQPPTLPKTPVREGFAVIEWGGVIR